MKHYKKRNIIRKEFKTDGKKIRERIFGRQRKYLD